MITTAIEFQLSWRGVPRPDPRAGVDGLRAGAAQAQAAVEEQALDLARAGCHIPELIDELHARFGLTPAERAARAAGRLLPVGNWNWYDARGVIAECLGLPEPAWDPVSQSWWQNHNAGALDWVRTPAGVAQVPVPDWPRTEPVARMLAAHARWAAAFPDDAGWARLWYLTLPGAYRSPEGGEPAAGIGYPSFVDLGLFLLGTTRFLSMIGGEPEMAAAWMDKCFELSTSFTEYMAAVAPVCWEALLGFGGDVSCMLSPRLYRQYGLEWDRRLFQYIRATHAVPADLPCNLHSCGPSAHLYDLWGQHPCHAHIATMQTRLLPGQVGRLRRNLPRTLLQLTLHPQHCDLAQVEPADFRHILAESARDAGYRDLHFTAFAVAQQPADLPRLEANLRVLAGVLADLEPAARAAAVADMQPDLTGLY